MKADIYQDYELNPRISMERPNKKNIYQELKSDFNNNKSGKKNNYLIYILAILLIICIYIFTRGDKSNKIHEVSKSLDYVQVDGETVEVSDVKIIKIPQKIYDSIGNSQGRNIAGYGDMINLDEYFLGNKKHLLLITRDGCPYARKFHNEINKAFKDRDISSYYTKDIKTTGKYFSFPCFEGEVCASVWLFERCGEGFCIINPTTKEIIADTSQDSNQILPLLKAYKSRYTEPLLD